MKLLTRKEEYVEKERFSNSLSLEIERKQKLLNDLNDKLTTREEKIKEREQNLEISIDHVENLIDEYKLKFYELDQREKGLKIKEQNFEFKEKLLTEQIDRFANMKK